MDIDTAEIDARLNALVEQRNTAQDQVAVLIGKLTVALNKIEKLEARVKELEPQSEE